MFGFDGVKAAISAALTVTQWVIFVAIIGFGVLHAAKEYVVSLQHPEFSAPSYVAWLGVVPFVVVAVVVVIILQIIKKA